MWKEVAELGLQSVGTIAQVVGAKKENERMRDFAREQADIAWNRQLDLYNRMKGDNSPLARRLQLNEAGLSPALLGGMAGSMGGSASGTSAPQGATPQLKNPMETANLGLMLAQIKNINADTKGKETENTNKQEGGIEWLKLSEETKQVIATTVTTPDTLLLNPCIVSSGNFSPVA